MRVMGKPCSGQGLPPGADPLESKDFSRQNGAGKGKRVSIDSSLKYLFNY